MKRFAVCMDGTWQTLRREGSTNVGIIARSVAHRASAPPGHDPIPQILIYEPGVGSMVNALREKNSKGGGDVAGGLFGKGLEDGILNAYLRVAYNYEAGDEIYIFGYSRGAFSARSLAALIGKCGIVSRRFAEKARDAFDYYRDKRLSADDPELKRFRHDFGKRVYDEQGRRVHADHRPKITYLGVFDTVGSRGLPSALGPLSEWVNRRYSFHDLNLSDMVRAARHALAIDERRILFPPTMWENVDALNARATEENRGRPYQQRWFIGGHGDVGGGVGSELSAFPLEWIVRGAEEMGLEMDRTPNSPFTEAVSCAECLAPVRKLPWTDFGAYLQRARRIAAIRGRAPPELADELIHESAAARAVSRKLPRPYKPPPLKPFLPALQAKAVPVALMEAMIEFLEPSPRRRKFLGLF